MDSADVDMRLRCGDCGGWADLPEHPDAPWLILRVKDFLDQHQDCSFAVTLTMPSQRQPLGKMDLTRPESRAWR